MNERMPASGELPTHSEAGVQSPVSVAPDGPPRPTPALVVAARLLLFLLAGLAFASAFMLARDRDAARESSSRRYVCPMHPEVVTPVAGDCPICGMALELVSGADKAASVAVAKSNAAVELVKRRIVTQLVRAPAWLASDGVVTAVLHKDDLVGMAPGERASFFGSLAPGVGRSASLSPGAAAPWDSSTIQVRFQVERAAPASPDTGWIQLAERPRQLLVVPASAVLYSGAGAYVLAAPPGGHTFTRRAVEIGRILDSGYVAQLAGDRFGGIVVLSGLQEGERVVAGDTFFLDAERRLQAARGNQAEVTP